MTGYDGYSLHFVGCHWHWWKLVSIHSKLWFVIFLVLMICHFRKARHFAQCELKRMKLLGTNSELELRFQEVLNWFHALDWSQLCSSLIGLSFVTNIYISSFRHVLGGAGTFIGDRGAWTDWWSSHGDDGTFCWETCASDWRTWVDLASFLGISHRAVLPAHVIPVSNSVKGVELSTVFSLWETRKKKVPVRASRTDFQNGVVL